MHSSPHELTDRFIIFGGTASPDLAAAIAAELGTPLGACAVERFPDGELSVRLDEPVRGREVFLVQSTSPPVNDHLIELLAFADACRRASATHLTAIIPYFGYARSDKRQARREPITASMVAELLQAVSVSHVVTLDLHAPQIEGFFRIPVDSLTALPVLSQAISQRCSPDTVIVSPDVGRAKLAMAYAERLGTDFAVLHKRRASGTELEMTHLAGNVRDRSCLIVDDMISTGGTIVESVAALRRAGARPEIKVAATHGLFVDGARERLSETGVQEIIVTDTVPRHAQPWPQLHVVSSAPLLAAAIRRFLTAGSLSDLC
ncbi:MAG: ribose-phosphate pyrophosphokinase [Blastocatellia bacterium]